MTKLEELGKIYVEWNIRKIDGNTAMCQIGKLFPRATNKEWRKYCDEIDRKIAEKEAEEHEAV